MWLQKIPFIVKLFLYLIIIFFMGAVFAGVISLMFEPEAEEASAWVFTAGYVLSIVIALAGGVSVENNGLHKIREQAMAMKSNINVIRGRIDNILFQLDPIVENQMNHEKEIYLKVSRNEAKKYRHLKSLGEVKASLSAYPVLRSDETVMRLFSQIVKEYEELANAKMAYNGYASQYNAGIKSFPVVLFRALSREGALEYYEDPTDEISCEKSAQFFNCAFFYSGNIRAGDADLSGDFPLGILFSVIEPVAHFQYEFFPGGELAFYLFIELLDIFLQIDFLRDVGFIGFHDIIEFDLISLPVRSDRFVEGNLFSVFFSSSGGT